MEKYLPNLNINPPEVTPQRDCHLRWICNYTWSGMRSKTILLVPLEAMQYDRALERYLMYIQIADSKYGIYGQVQPS